MKVINTLKFKVVNESVKKTDRHDAATIAEFWRGACYPKPVMFGGKRGASEAGEKPEGFSEGGGKYQNQIHGLLLGFGIELAEDATE